MAVAQKAVAAIAARSVADSRPQAKGAPIELRVLPPTPKPQQHFRTYVPQRHFRITLRRVFTAKFALCNVNFFLPRSSSGHKPCHGLMWLTTLPEETERGPEAGVRGASPGVRVRRTGGGMCAYIEGGLSPIAILPVRRILNFIFI